MYKKIRTHLIYSIECVRTFFVFYFSAHPLSHVPAFALHINCVIVPIGQYTHQLLGLNNTIVTNPSTVDVSMTL